MTNGENGDVAANSYQLYKEDVKIAKNMQLDHYRFSISWTRVMPNGDTSIINEAGIRYYDNLINEILANGMEPLVTMYHWDLPQSLQDLGGMTNPLVVNYFKIYADLLFKRFGDRVKMWITFNEPTLMCGEGYGTGNMAPLITSQGIGVYLCSHHLLLAHATIYDLYYKNYKWQGGKVGIVNHCQYFWPKNPNNPEHVKATERALQFNVIFFIYFIMTHHLTFFF